MFVKRFAWCVLASVIVCSLSLADEPQHASSTAPSTIKQSLKQAGATCAELGAIEEGLRQATPGDIAGYQNRLRQRAPAVRAKTVKSMSYDVRYVLGPDSLPQSGVPRGKVIEFTLDQSNIFPCTTRKITAYVPAEYAADNPACVFVATDDGLRHSDI